MSRAAEPQWTIGGLLADRLRRTPEAIAISHRPHGSPGYQAVTWRQLGALVGSALRVLDGYGVERGARVAIMSSPRLEYLVVEYALYVRGAVSVGVYPTSSDSTLRHILGHSGSVLCIAEAQADVSRAQRLAGEDGSLAMRFVEPLEELWAGVAAAPGKDGLADIGDAAAAVGPDDAACLIYTSGTTGPPKGVVHSHRTFLHAALASAPAARRREQRMLWHLPASHVVGKLRAFAFPLIRDMVVWIPLPGTPFVESMREARPTVLNAPPRFYEKAIEAAGPPARHSRSYRAAMRISESLVDRLWARERGRRVLAVAIGLMRRLVFGRVLEAIGFDHIEVAYTGSAPVPPEMVRVFHAWGVDLRITYGLTETGGRVLGHTRAFTDPRLLGEPVAYPGLELRVEGDGELLVRGPCLFRGYWQDPTATGETLADGWLRTGDLVELEPSGRRFRLTGRKKEIITTSGGKSLSPAAIEAVLEAQPPIRRAVVVGDGRRFVTALVEPAASAGSLDEGIVQRVAAAVADANRELGRVEQVKRFRVLPLALEELDPEAVTPTGKLRRRVIEQACGAVIDEMYGDAAADAGIGRSGTPDEGPYVRARTADDA